MAKESPRLLKGSNNNYCNPQVNVDTTPFNTKYDNNPNPDIERHDKIYSSGKTQTDTSSEDFVSGSNTSTALSFYSADNRNEEEEIYAVSLGWRKPAPFHFLG